MAVLPLLTYPDPLLTEISVPISTIDDKIHSLIADMKETMYASRGVGLAAPQVGHSLRLIVMDASQEKDENDFKILINPELEFLGSVIVSEREGCLSVPYDFRADVKRYESVRVQYMQLDGSKIDEIWNDFPAIVIQHEYDHLEGKLFIDHLSRLRRSLFESKVKKNLKRDGK